MPIRLLSLAATLSFLQPRAMPIRLLSFAATLSFLQPASAATEWSSDIADACTDLATRTAHHHDIDRPAQRRSVDTKHAVHAVEHI